MKALLMKVPLALLVVVVVLLTLVLRLDQMDLPTEAYLLVVVVVAVLLPRRVLT